ncbi:MAG TPA: hypothetical protein VMR16_03660 [Candidatus Saccharimonadales bacterium]|nr:hypothetical protein [Candidatus Saccharimonadales bacterium]
MKNQSIDNPLKLLMKLIGRYNFVIFIIIISIGLSASVLILNDILNRPYSATSQSAAPTTRFDQSTITRLSKLETSANNNTYNTLPPGRVNPFSE